ncbi:MAG TPA: tRNA (N(6)-L-threonylcarbamoyladenosine(37)-C(2))-methylthiotransferase MtaB [Bacteroidota bacterium]|nr:tRNA (N(6)-L-threonylcarbamoyladenosine(37)-C(2))-methylthiotransferase MtaB [Bacteroidota bacterium]
MPTIALTTLGCKLNFAETSSLGKQFFDRGFRPVEFGAPADLTLINTCSVTAHADRECRQLIRRSLRASPGSVVVVTGCYAQLRPEEVASIEGVDFVVGTREKQAIASLLTGGESACAADGPRAAAARSGAGLPAKQALPRVLVGAIGDVAEFAPAWTTEAGGRTRAFLKVQDGCDYACTFCTIPMARGASRSQPIPETVRQAEALVAEGYREIVLTGVNVGDYGKATGDGLLPLLRALAAVRGVERLRISSIEPNLLTDEIIRFIAAEPVMCRHVHVPLQSGANDVLRLMRRRYTAERYAERVRTVIGQIPDCGIGADVIVGFPGETDAHFRETCAFIADLPVSYLHVFSYSERPGTPAASSGAQVSPHVRAERSAILRGIGLRKKTEFHRRMIGKTVPVLLEADEDAGCRCGFTGNYVRVAVGAADAPENAIVDVAIAGTDGERCTGRVAPGSAR